jgi:hypothetical protein
LLFLGVLALVFFLFGSAKLRHRYYELHQHASSPTQPPNRIEP